MTLSYRLLSLRALDTACQRLFGLQSGFTKPSHLLVQCSHGRLQLISRGV